MSKKRQDLELELRKLDIDRRDVDVRIRSIEQSPRNQRILKGDFSRPPPRAGDTRRFVRGRGTSETENDTPTKRPREGESVKEESTPAVSEKEKEEKPEDEKEEESTPSVLSAVVVSEEPEAKEETPVKPERGNKRKLAGNAEISKRDKRIFSSLLMGHLNQAQNRLKVDRDNANIKKKEELEAKVSQKISQRTVGIREKEAEHLVEQRDHERKLRSDIIRKEEVKRRELDELIILEHEENLSNFIRTQTEPFVYYLPASHTEKTKKLLAKTKEMHDARIADGSAMLEKDLDQGFIDELFKGEENNSSSSSSSSSEKAAGEDATKGKDGDKSDKEKEKDEDHSKKDAEKDKKARDDSPPKKGRKKAKEESSSSSSDSSDSD